MFPEPQRVPFRRQLLRWYARHGRDLPWRRTSDPYSILISEFMLQQTQVVAVVKFYHRWLERFPSILAVAAASDSEVLHAWQGLGYYSRARNLHAAAKYVVANHNGILPRDPEELQRLAGVGRYTANAIATFAFDRPVPVVEANTARLISRLINMREPIDSKFGREALWNRAAALVPKRNAGKFNSALMDLGATICRPRQPSCGRCPVKRFCNAIDPESLPRKKPRTATKRLVESHSLIVRQNKVLLEQARSRWHNMWILPRLNPAAPNQITSKQIPVYTTVFPFTNHRITLQVFRRSTCKTGDRRLRWFSRRALDAIPVPSPHRRALCALLE